MDKEIYVYSGIQPGKKGTGNFLSFFLDKFHKNNIKFTLIAYKTPSLGFIAKIAKQIGIIKILRTLYFKINRASSKKNIIDSIVFIFHPQSIGLNSTTSLIENNETFIYVLDTFFFCKQSYNYLKNNEACFQCIDNPKAAIDNKCKFFLSSQKDEEYHNLQLVIKENLNNIHFLTQNDNQTQLLKENYGVNVSVTKLGMLIDLEDSNDELSYHCKTYDIVFHNTNILAKGVLYFLELANKLPDLKFLMPYDKKEIAHSVDHLKNVDFISMSWETGLKEAITNTKIVINPSLWSAPVEGALLKSLNHNGCVAIVPIDFSFQKEIPSDTIIHLHSSIEKSASILTKVINSNNQIELYKKKSKEWLLNYQEETNSNFNTFFNKMF